MQGFTHNGCITASLLHQPHLKGNRKGCALSLGSQRQHQLFASMFVRQQEEHKTDPWAMADADIAVYDRAFVKQDKDKDGFISLRGKRV